MFCLLGNNVYTSKKICGIRRYDLIWILSAIVGVCGRIIRDPISDPLPCTVYILSQRTKGPLAREDSGLVLHPSLPL